MSSKAKAVIDAAFIRLERATESSTEASKLLRAAYTAALEGEKAHRRMGRSFGGSYAASVATAARYFVCKWYSDGGRHPSNAREACAMRADCLNAMALRELHAVDGDVLPMPGILEIDYSRDLVGES